MDLAVLWGPALAFFAGAIAGGVQLATTGNPKSLVWLGVGVMFAGLLGLIKCRFAYRSDVFEHLTVAALLHRVKVSAVRPVPTTLTGRIIGKGVPGLVWSEDFVMQDNTGLIFLDYRQPLHIWEWLFGLFRAGEFAGKPVEAVGWFRRAPLPYLELKSITVDGVTRHSYARHARYAWAVLLAVVGTGLVVWGLLGG